MLHDGFKLTALNDARSQITWEYADMQTNMYHMHLFLWYFVTLLSSKSYFSLLFQMEESQLYRSESTCVWVHADNIFWGKLLILDYVFITKHERWPQYLDVEKLLQLV